MALAVAALLFSAYVANVVMGALFRSPFMGDVPEMITLLIASIFFVAAILRSEAKAKQAQEKSGPR